MKTGTYLSVSPKRRWFRFSLRTLFLVVTVFCLWLGWQASVVRERKSLLRSLENDPHLLFDPLHTSFGPGKMVLTFGTLTNHRDGPYVPWFRRMLGDDNVTSLGLPSEMTEEDLRRFKIAFPEAVISQEPVGMRFSTPVPKP